MAWVYGGMVLGAYLLMLVTTLVSISKVAERMRECRNCRRIRSRLEELI